MSRALVISDVDEVVLAFAAGLDRFLADHDLVLDRARYALTGNIRHRRTGAPVDADLSAAILEEFKRDAAHALEPVAHAARTLAGLAAVADIHFLTNISANAIRKRGVHLRRLGMPYPVTANHGLKGEAAARLARRHRKRHPAGAVFFLDDSHANLRSVADAAPEVALIHFIAYEGFRSVAPRVPDAVLRTGDWRAVDALIRQHVNSGAGDEGSVT